MQGAVLGDVWAKMTAKTWLLPSRGLWVRTEGKRDISGTEKTTEPRKRRGGSEDAHILGA